MNAIEFIYDYHVVVSTELSLNESSAVSEGFGRSQNLVSYMNLQQD
jgi:hypothetical protein